MRVHCETAQLVPLSDAGSLYSGDDGIALGSVVNDAASLFSTCPRSLIGRSLSVVTNGVIVAQVCRPHSARAL